MGQHRLDPDKFVNLNNQSIKHSLSQVSKENAQKTMYMFNNLNPLDEVGDRVRSAVNQKEPSTIPYAPDSRLSISTWGLFIVSVLSGVTAALIYNYIRDK